MTWSVGFDLDMTLVDTRSGIVASLDALSAETGIAIDSAAYVSQLGPPVTEELERVFGKKDALAALAIFRRHMADTGVFGSTALPGAVEALDLVRRLGGESLVVTAKHHPLAQATLVACRLSPDYIEGDLWAEQKATALLRHRAVGYVGDHPGDVRAADAAGIWCLGVATGGYSSAELLDAGATVAFGSLIDAQPWLESALSDALANP